MSGSYQYDKIMDIGDRFGVTEDLVELVSAIENESFKKREKEKSTPK